MILRIKAILFWGLSSFVMETADGIIAWDKMDFIYHNPIENI